MIREGVGCKARETGGCPQSTHGLAPLGNQPEGWRSPRGGRHPSGWFKPPGGGTGAAEALVPSLLVVVAAATTTNSRGEGSGSLALDSPIGGCGRITVT